MSVIQISILETLLAMIVFPVPGNSYWEKCIAERCFTIPGSNDAKNFEDAKMWCNQINSSLVTVGNDNIQEALVQFLNSAQVDDQPKSAMFIDLTLVKNDSTWFLVDGTNYLGGISEQNQVAYWFYAYLKQHPIMFEVDGSKPNTPRNFICEFHNNKCSTDSPNNFLSNDGCFVKYENESLTWFKARERCRHNGGDLAEFNYNSGTPNYPLGVPFNTTWLNTSNSYWVGIRYRNLRWKSFGYGSNDEAIYTSWSSDEPNNIANECVCVDPSGNPAWSWTDCSCTESRQFVCLKIVPTTIATTTTPTTTTTDPSRTSSAVPDLPSNVTTSSSSSQPIKGRNMQEHVLAIGLGAGIGGGVFLILLVVIVVLAVYFARRRRKKNNDTGSKFDNTPATTTSNIAPAAPKGSDIYAQVVPTTNRLTNKKSENDVNDVIYSRPEFSSSENSTQHGSDTSKKRQEKALSVVLEGPSDVYANAASVS